MTGKIFINYRRDDSGGTAGRLYDRLAQTFGRERLFMDVDQIPAGVDFVTYLNTQVGACDIFLAVIGPHWLNAKDGYGRRRLDNPDDFVSVEIATALARNIRVIPILVDGAFIPTTDELPDSIKPLVRRNAVEVRNTHFGRDAKALVEKIREALKSPRERLPFLASAAALLRVSGWRHVAAGSAAGLLLVGWIGLYQMESWVAWAQPADAQAEQQRLKEEVQRQAKAAADAEEKRKAAEVEQQRLKEEVQRQAKAAADAEAKRKAEAEARARAEQAEKERMAAARAEEERKAKAAAQAEARRKVTDAEQQQLAAVKVEEERRKQAEAEARTRYSVLVNQSYTELHNGDYDRAIATASEAMRLDPKNALAFINRAAAYARKGDMDRAIADSNEAIRLDPNSALAVTQRGMAYDNKGDFDRAIADFNEAIRLDPNNAFTFTTRGNIYLNKGHLDRAIADFNEAIRLDPKGDGRSFFGRGTAYGRKGDFDRAIADLNEAIRLDPNSATNSYNNRGHVYLNKGDLDQAIADFNEAIRLEPDSPNSASAFVNRGNAYSRNGDNNGAIADYNEAIRLNPDYALAFCNRGRVKLKIKDASGKADIAKARQLDTSVCR